MISNIIFKRANQCLTKNTARAIATSQSKLTNKIGSKSESIFKREDKFGAHNYHPLPVAISKASG
jgi:ornithine--oxo-acid transaminase